MIYQYKGFKGVAELNEAGYYFGRIDGIRDVITFTSNSLDDLEKEFQLSVDDYLAFLADLKEQRLIAMRF